MFSITWLVLISIKRRRGIGSVRGVSKRRNLGGRSQGRGEGDEASEGKGSDIWEGNHGRPHEHVCHRPPNLSTPSSRRIQGRQPPQLSSFFTNLSSPSLAKRSRCLQKPSSCNSAQRVTRRPNSPPGITTLLSGFTGHGCFPSITASRRTVLGDKVKERYELIAGPRFR